MFFQYNWDTSYRYIFYFQYQPQVSPHFYYMLGANLGLFLYGEASVMKDLRSNVTARKYRHNTGLS